MKKITGWYTFMVFKLYFRKAVKNHIQKNGQLGLQNIFNQYSMKNHWMAMKLDKKWKEAKHTHDFSMN